MSKTMFRLTVTTLALAVFAGGAQAIDEDNAGCTKVCKKIIIQGDGDAQDGQAHVICIKAGEGGNDDVATWVIKGDGDEQVVNLTALGAAGWTGLAPLMLTVGSAPDPSRGWLGVGLGEVSPALAAQMGVEGEGVMITNVVKDSPAAAAGLERYDVVLSVNGQPVDGSVAAFAEAVGEAGPSSPITLSVLHQGKTQTLRVTLGSRPDQVIEWTHDIDVGPSISERFRTRGKILRMLPEGLIEIDELGDLKDLGDLPDAIQHLIPHVDDVFTKVWVDKSAGDVNTHITTRVEKDGQTLEIEQEGDDTITVRRTTVDDNGDTQTTEKAYASAEELEADDEEAFEIYSQIQGRHMIDLRFGGSGAPGVFHFDFDMDDLKSKLHDHGVQIEVEEALQGAREAYQEAMKSVKDHPWGQYRRFGPGSGFFFGHGDRAWHNFNVDSDGAVEIRIRKGDTEVVLNYDNEDDLRRQNPDMYEKFADVINAPLEN